MKANVKRTTEQRVVAVMLLFSLFALYLTVNIFRLSVIKGDYYKMKAYDQVTTSTPLIAKRGMIYDSSLGVLARSDTAFRIFVSTRDIKAASKEDGVDYAKVIAEGVSKILSLKSDTVYKKITNTSLLDVTLKKSASEEEYRAVLDFVSSFSLEGLIQTEAESSRYYPQGTLAAHTLGFTGSDSQGLYGLEYYYDKILSGSNGYYLYAKDANGKALDTEYTEYIPTKDGYSIVTTLDSYIQSELEAILESARINHGVENRVCGIVMDTKTGAILAMATSSPFDPNDPFTLDEVSMKKLSNSGYLQGTEEYKKYKTELMQLMWSNKAVSETYEPGSTFKIVTVSAALDSGTSKVGDTFSCNGYRQIGGYRIKCHKVKGHGTGFDLSYGLQMSCNPCMISVSEKLGAEAFYSYVKKFGYFEKSGIDLPSEARTIFHNEDAIGVTELATASFGQRFKVSIINHLRAISAVANGGVLVNPYLVERVIDSNGNTVSEHEEGEVRRVISKECADTVSKILIDGVNGDGGAKNAGVAGYDIAAKTGTSQKFDVLDENGNSYLRIGSTVAYSTDSEHGISMIIVVDEPTSDVKYGSVVAAPYISALAEKILPYLEYEKNGEQLETAVESFVGMSIESAKNRLNKLGISYEVVGGGKTVLSQTPSAGSVFTYPISKVILFTEMSVPEYTEVPALVGLELPEAIRRLTAAGLNIKISGIAATNPSGHITVSYQSTPQGTRVKRGYVVTIRAINTEHED